MAVQRWRQGCLANTSQCLICQDQRLEWPTDGENGSERFEYYAEGQSLTDPKKKTAQLLHFAGMDLQDLFEDLPDHNPPSSGDDAYKKAIRKLDYRFKFEENFPRKISRTSDMFSTDKTHGR